MNFIYKFSEYKIIKQNAVDIRSKKKRSTDMHGIINAFNIA